MRGIGPRLAALGVACCLAAFAGTEAATAAPALPAGFQDTVVFPGLEKPTAIRFAPNGMVFVAEKNGKIEVYENLADETPELFKDLTLETYDHGDRGLLGLAVDPAFPAKPYVYALFTYDHVLGSGEPAPEWGSEEHPEGDSCPALKGADDCVVSGRLVRYTAEVSEDGEGALSATEVGETPLIAEEWCQQFSSHSIGDLRFGLEGALYVSGGDGASFGSTPDYGQLGEPPNPCDDPANEGGSLRAQDLLTPETLEDPTGLNGTIVRIDPETGEGWPGNPLAKSASANERRIVATGFRNPFRFALDPKTGEMYVGNVGSSEYEEIDRFNPTAGLYNSGWPCYEGDNPQYQFKELGLPICKSLEAEPEQVTQPLFYYSHRSAIAPGDECPYASGSAIAGPAFYEGEEFGPEYEGALFFADAVRGCIYVMPAGEDGRPDPDMIETFMTGGSLYPGVDIEEGPDGSLYYASLFGEGFSKGAIHRITYAPGSPAAKLTADTQYSKDVEHEFHLDASESSDPDGEELNFGWDLNGNGSFETEGGETQTVKYTEAKNVVVAVKVTDKEGLSNVAKLTLYPGDTPPVPTIKEPVESHLWYVGDEIHLSGSAINANEENVEPLFLSWGTRILHCPNGPEDCHSHPLQDFPGTQKGDLVTPEHDYPSYVEITLTASDKRGLSASKTIKLKPRTVDLAMKSSPGGISLTAGWLTQLAPFSLTAIEGSNIGLAAPQTAVVEGKTYDWQSWSDGGARTHSVSADKAASYEAVYAPEEEPEEEPTTSSPPPPPVKVPSPPADTTPPQTKLRKHPPKKTRSRVAKFVFGSNEGSSRFFCKLDRGKYRRCGARATFRKLKRGRHVLRVYAVDAAGNRDKSPAVFVWKVR